MRLRTLATRLHRDESGQTLVLAAIMLPVLIAFVGFAVDVGYAFDYKKQMQLAADSAAMAGAIAVKADGSISSTDLTTVVTMDTAANGFTNGSGGIIVNVCRPAVDLTCPTAYTYTAGDGAVKVSISQAKDTFFTKILSFNSMTIGASAVAAKANSGGNSNIVILNTNCETGFSVTGGSTVTVEGSIYANSCGSPSVLLSGGSTITAPGGVFIGCNGGTCGTYNAGGGSVFNPTPTTGQPQIADPLAGLPAPTPYGPQFTGTNINSTTTLDPGIYNGGLTVRGGTVTFKEGDYFINGGTLWIKGSVNAIGTGVFFYAYNGARLVIENPTASVTMSAPTSGTYRGIWYFQERSNAQSASVAGNATMNIDGVIYISNPAATFTFAGNSTSGSLASYTVFVVWKLLMSGSGAFGADFSSVGGSPLGGPSGLALAE